MDKKTITTIHRLLVRAYPTWHVPIVELIEAQTKDPFKVLITTMLSARTKDQVTAQAATRLFQKINTPKDLEKSSLTSIEKMIYPVGFHKTKAKHLKALPLILQTHYSGKVPDRLEDLLTLPGVGRKTANIVLATAFQKPAIGVDTHVHRISNRLGLVVTNNPSQTEKELTKLLPKRYWLTWNTYIVALGQRICAPISPKCSECPLTPHCKKVGVKKNR